MFNSDHVLSLTKCPASITIIGGGAIGVEFTSLFNTLDRDVTIIEMMDEILPGMYPEVARTLRKSMENKGVRIFTSAKVTAIESGAASTVCRFEQNGQVQVTESAYAVVAIGRKPRSQNIWLKNIGIETVKGAIPINDQMEMVTIP